MCSCMLLPSGSSSPRVKLVFNNFIGDDGCKIASFKCVVVEKGYNATVFLLNPTTGERLATYEMSQTESIGGNITCAPESADWRFNGVKASIRCEWSILHEITFPTRKPATPITTSTPVKPATTTSDCG